MRNWLIRVDGIGSGKLVGKRLESEETCSIEVIDGGYGREIHNVSR